jgi:hypothetical protein
MPKPSSAGAALTQAEPPTVETTNTACESRARDGCFYGATRWPRVQLRDGSTVLVAIEYGATGQVLPHRVARQMPQERRRESRQWTT